MGSRIKAVIWDFGGVLTTSPFEAFNTYEAANGLPADFIRSVNAQNADTNAWAKLERSEINTEEFDRLFRTESLTFGHEIPGYDVLKLLSGELRPRIVTALKACRRQAKTGCITNNIPRPVDTASPETGDWRGKFAAILDHFDHILESSRIGIRKPDPRIYALMCEALDVEAADCVYLDDIGSNLKPAQAMGMTTIKVEDEMQLLEALATATGFDLE